MLPGNAIADTIPSLPAGGRSDAARAGSGKAGGASDFEALLRGKPARNAEAGKSTARESGGASQTASNQTKAGRPAADRQADRPEQAVRAPRPSADNTGDTQDAVETSPASRDENAADEAVVQPEGSTEPGEATPASAGTGGSAPAGATGNMKSAQDVASPAAQAENNGEKTGGSAAGPAGPAEPAPADSGAPDPAISAPADPSGGGESTAGGETLPGSKTAAAGNANAAGTAPAMPAGETAPATSKPEPSKSAEPALSQTAQPAQPKGSSGQQTLAQPAASAPGTGTSASQSDAPDAAQAAASNAQQAKAELAVQPARADGEVPNAAAFRREMERGMTRGQEGLEQARATAEKPEAGAKDAPSRPRSAGAMPGTPAPAPASTVPAAATPPTMAAMLTALQSGIALPETLDGGESSEGGELRLESSSALLARNESASLAGTRTTSALPHLRMASGHVAELGQMIARRFADGSRSFDIRLDPPELGRVQVRLEIGADRSVQAMLTAEKPEALAELQRNARELEKALADAGLDLGENGIGFALSEGGDDDQPARDTDGRADAPAITNTLTVSDASTPPPVSRYGFLMAGRTGVDMRI